LLYGSTMHFDSIQFLLFFVVVTLTYFSLRWTGRWWLLLLASCYFYMVFKPVYILVLFGTIIIDYFAGIWIAQAHGTTRKWLLALSIVTNVGILAFFKYFNFFAQNINALAWKAQLGFSIPMLQTIYPDLILPIGLSFHTFQAMSYTIEVYRGNQPVERHFGIYALYVMFYPQLVAGPIERPQNVLHQFHTFFPYDWQKVKEGLMQMAWGFFKKVAIADRLSLLAGPIYDHHTQHNGLTLLMATFFYAFRIYCDFSGYSDIAIGAAKVMGFKLMDNFKTPYASASIAEFWSRWHISLSTWFRDYLYIPLGGNRRGEARKSINQFTVFLVSGLWHGAHWNYVIWGGLHGFYLVFASIRDKIFKKFGLSTPTLFAYRWVNVIVTFVLVMVTWVFFAVGDRGSVRQSMDILKQMASFSYDGGLQMRYPHEIGFSLFLIVLLLLKEHYFLEIPTRNSRVFWVIFPIISVLCYFLGVFTNNQFIYFQF
jgi:alginate O-acetyltransferase complex protein AlgI